MREVEVFQIVKGTKEVRGTALFHGWGAEYEEFEAGPGNQTCAIVEWPSGQVELVHPSLIRFTKPFVLVEETTSHTQQDAEKRVWRSVETSTPPTGTWLTCKMGVHESEFKAVYSRGDWYTEKSTTLMKDPKFWLDTSE